MSDTSIGNPAAAHHRTLSPDSFLPAEQEIPMGEIDPKKLADKLEALFGSNFKIYMRHSDFYIKAERCLTKKEINHCKTQRAIDEELADSRRLKQLKRKRTWQRHSFSQGLRNLLKSSPVA